MKLRLYSAAEEQIAVAARWYEERQPRLGSRFLWVADIPFTDGTASKRRPVLILWLDGNDVVVAAVKSARPRSAQDVSLADWQASGLRLASTVRLSRLDCLEQSLFVGRIGVISAADGKRVKHAWATHVNLQF